MSPLYLMMGVGSVFAVLFFYGLLERRPDPTVALRAKYLKLIRAGKDEGPQMLAERLESLSRKYPGRTYRWYLQWLVTDLERSKR